MMNKYKTILADPPSPEMVCPKAETCDCPCQGKHPHKKNVGCTNKPTEGCPDCVPVPSPEHPEKVRETLALERWIELTGEIQGDWTWEQAKTNAPMSTKSVQQERDWWILKLQQAGWKSPDEISKMFNPDYQNVKNMTPIIRAKARQQAFQEAKQWLDELFKKGVSSFKYTSYSEGTYYLTFPYDDFTAVQNKIKSEQPKE